MNPVTGTITDNIRFKDIAYIALPTLCVTNGTQIMSALLNNKATTATARKIGSEFKVLFPIELLDINRECYWQSETRGTIMFNGKNNQTSFRTIHKVKFELVDDVMMIW